MKVKEVHGNKYKTTTPKALQIGHERIVARSLESDLLHVNNMFLLKMTVQIMGLLFLQFMKDKLVL